jgi:hypothetical protein
MSGDLEGLTPARLRELADEYAAKCDRGEWTPEIGSAIQLFKGCAQRIEVLTEDRGELIDALCRVEALLEAGHPARPVVRSALTKGRT